MTEIRRLAVATDRSAGGDHAVDLARALVGPTTRSLIIQVVDPDGGDPATAAAALEEFAAAALPGSEVAASASSTPAEVIVETASAWGADLLVVGNSGMRGRQEFLLGNVANRVSHLARCSVLIANSADAAQSVPADHGEEGSDAALTGRGLEIARELGPVVLQGLAGRVLGRHDDPEAPRRLREALERLGPTFSKIGQILSTRPDIVPAAYIDELSHLQSSVPPMPEAEVVRTMELELGVPWEDVFASIDPEPLAAGTIGQVHRATLADGARVVVKVQRPTAAAVIEADLALLETLVARVHLVPRMNTLIDLPSVVDQLGRSLRAELDFGEEAANLDAMATQLDRYPLIAVPRCHHELSTARLLVMDEVSGGVPLDEVDDDDPARPEAARQLLHAFYQQVLEDGVFHADPHPGNLLWADGKVWLIDLGMVGRLDPAVRRKLVVLLLAVARSDASLLGDVVLSMAPGRPERLDVEAFDADLARLLGSLHGRSLEDLQLGEVLDDLTDLSVRHGLPLPSDLIMVGKALAQVQLSISAMDPTLDPVTEAGRFFASRFTAQMVERFDPEKVFFEVEKLGFRLSEASSTLAAIAGGRPGQALQVRFSSERLEDRIAVAGRTVALGAVAGLAWVAAANRHASPAWRRTTAAVAAGLTGLTAVVSVRRRA